MSTTPSPSPLSESAAEIRPLRAAAGPTTEELVVQSIRDGHPQGPARLYDHYARDIHKVVQRVLGPDADHEDIVHEIFIKAWQLIARGKLREPEKLGSWLKSIAVHTVYKEIRRRYVRRRYFFLDQKSADALSLHGPGGDEHDLLRIIYALAARLAPQHRLAFALRHFEQKRLTEVADLIGCSLATAKRRLALAEGQFLLLSAEYQADYPALRALVAGAEGEKS